MVTTVWWDMNICPIPKGYDPRCVRPSIESALNKSGVDEHVTIFAVGSLIRLTPHDRNALSSSGINMINNDLGARGVYQEISMWLCDNSPPGTLMLISDDPYAESYYHPKLVHGTLLPGEKPYSVISAYPRAHEKEEWRWKNILQEAPTPPTEVLKCPREPLWKCRVCYFETNAYDEFAKHLYDIAHETKLYDSCWPPESKEQVFYDRFKKDKALMLALEQNKTGDLEHLSQFDVTVSSSIEKKKNRRQKQKQTRQEENIDLIWLVPVYKNKYETCPACYAHVSPRDKLEVSGCFHRICYTCIRDCVSSELARGDTVLCPYPDCKKELVLEDCRGIVDDDAINLMIHRKKEKAIPILDRVYCPKPSCNFLMSDRDLPLGNSIDPRQKSVARKCVECGLCFCKKCHVPWHYKKTCDEFKKSESYLTSDAGLFESLVKTQGWMKCPQCATVVQQNGGCKRITCRHCNHKFCYTCGAACTKKKMTCKCNPLTSD